MISGVSSDRLVAPDGSKIQSMTMSSDNAKKRKLKCQDDASSAAGKEDGERGDSLEAMMAEMRGQMTSMQSEMDNLKDRISCVDELQNRCEDLERSLRYW